jgi:hypothetical protein
VSAFTALDRCDRCGAQAYASAELPTGLLLFCAHHLREHGPALQASGVTVHDETSTLTPSALG